MSNPSRRQNCFDLELEVMKTENSVYVMIFKSYIPVPALIQ